MPETRCVGVLSPFVGGDYYGAVIAGVHRAARQAGDRLIALQTLDPGSHGADYSGVPDYRHPIARAHVAGVVVLPGAIDADQVRAFQRAGTPVVLLSHDLPGVDAAKVGPDNASGVRQAVEHLAAQGHDRIAFGGNLAVRDVQERHAGYLRTLAALGLEALPELLFRAPDNHETGGVAVAAAMIRAGLPASAVVMGTDRNAIGLMGHLAAAGYRVPDDLAVIGFDDITDARYTIPSLSSVSQPLDLLGAAAYEALQDAWAAVRSVGDGGRRLVPTRFVRRDSCGCPRQGLAVTEAEARARFADNTYLQMTLNAQYGLGAELLRSHERDPRGLGWLAHTPAVAGCLGLWSGRPAGADPRIEVAGTFRAGGEPPDLVGSVLPVSSFPPAELFDIADDDAGEIVFVVPVRSGARDWGVLAAVGTIQDTTPPGREMMNHSGSLLAVALDHAAVLQSLHDQQEQLRRAALHDQLTGLPNRALFLDRLHRAARRAARHPDNRFAVLFLDLNGFKQVNDTLGHAAGDRLLVHVAESLGGLLRTSDTAARLGGDEFVILLDGLAGPDAAELVVQRVHAALGEPVDLDGHPVHISVSIGVAASDGGDGDPEQILKRADAAMYRAKPASSE